MSEKEQLFQAWLDGNLNEQQSQRLEALASEDEELRSRLAAARYIEQQVHGYEAHTPENWDPASIMGEAQAPWWQWPGLSLASLACSCFAIALVLLNVQVTSQQDGFAITFGSSSNSIDEQKLEQLLDQCLQQFAAEQEIVLANYVSDFKDQQQANNLQLAGYLLTATRQERQEDISHFIQYVDEQRSEDALDNKLKYQRLEYALQTQAIKQGMGEQFQQTKFNDEDE
ncbi:anti-sigma factor family protein [Thalassotalea sp. PS06]|uniref:anti-sigma factor family protein n=1 Tax=Thalassotalea sp. PS06 TaxID=2594005 RepID=UPI0011624B18|nr:hypothetical protein [Thalassotalea sp. PS06]QDP00797.1 hypothetical protein FNC98_05185 [Thalassotalea sp. PS06]